MDSNFEKYQEEYLTLVDNFPNTNDWEINHRKKILKDWLDNEIEKAEREEKILKRFKELDILKRPESVKKIVRESLYEDKEFFLREVLRDEDEWADREIAKYLGEPVEEPKKTYDDHEKEKWDHFNSMKVKRFSDEGKYIPPDITEEEFEKIKLVNSIHALQEHIWEYGDKETQGVWQDYLYDVGFPHGIPTNAREWNEIPDELLRDVYDVAYELTNSLKK